MRLRELERGHADFTLHGASKVTFTYAKLLSELPDAASVEAARGDPVRRDVREPWDGVDDRSAWRELGPTAQTWAKARALCCRRGVEEPTVVRV